MVKSALTFRQFFATLFLLFVGLFAASALSAWAGPTAMPPSGNVAAPINVGTTDQVKNAGLSVNSFAVFGSQYIQDKLGIGRPSPVVPLDVNGTIRIANSGEVCQAVTEGAVRYNSSSQVLQLCDGTNWRTLTLAAPSTQRVIILTSGNTWSVPSEWNNLNNTIEVIGGGGGGGPPSGNVATAGGGGGGGYSKVTNLSLTPGSTAYIRIGSGGGENSSGGDTWLSSVNAAPTNTSQGVLAKGGAGAGGGGASASGVGNIKYSGGNGGASGPYGATGGGGGGAAGPHGMGNNGSAGSFPSTGGAGASGDAGSGGSGGANRVVGGNGTEWDASTGSGGGGGGGSTDFSQSGNCTGGGGAGGTYGGGGGGGSYAAANVTGYVGSCPGASGRQGVIVITYMSQ